MEFFPISRSNPRFKAAALELIYRQSRLANLAVLVNSAIYAIVSWNIVDHFWLGLWLSVIYLQAIIKILFVEPRLRSAPKDPAKVERLLFQFKVGTLFSGLMWGAMGSVLLVPESSVHLGVTTFILAGMTSGAAGAYSISLRTVYCYIYPTLIPFIITLLTSGQRELALMGIMGTLYLLLMTVISRNINRASTKALQLGLDNQDLLNSLYNASHEIRTPVLAINGFSEMLRNNSQATVDIKNYANTIYRNSVYLKRLVENLLLRKTSEAPRENGKDLVALKDEIATAVNMVDGKLKEKNLNLEVSYAPGLPEKLKINVLEFQQILINLISNAIKFTHKGKISVSVGMRNGKLSVQVKDTGIGVGLDAKDKLFQPFYRENRDEVREQEGSGLGLNLARDLARRLDGDLRLVESELGKGSTFEFLISAEIPNDTTDLSGTSILIVDDTEDNRDLLKTVFEEEGARVETCADGVRAVEMVSEHEKDFDLVLMDLNMPSMDGYEATELIRKRGIQTPIVALTAHSMVEENKLKQSGFTQQIDKLMNVNELISTVGRLSRRQGTV